MQAGIILEKGEECGDDDGGRDDGAAEGTREANINAGGGRSVTTGQAEAHALALKPYRVLGIRRR